MAITVRVNNTTGTTVAVRSQDNYRVRTIGIAPSGSIGVGESDGLAFNQANAAYDYANTVYTYAANDVMLVANSAYTQANVALNTANNAYNFSFLLMGG